MNTEVVSDKVVGLSVVFVILLYLFMVSVVVLRLVTVKDTLSVSVIDVVIDCVTVFGSVTVTGDGIITLEVRTLVICLYMFLVDT